MDEAELSPPKHGQLMPHYHIKGYFNKVSEEAGFLEEKIKLLQAHLYFAGEHDIDVNKGIDMVFVRVKTNFYDLVNQGKLQVSSLGKDGKLRDVSVRFNKDDKNVNLELTIEGTKYSIL